ncbi:MAG: glycosyltransferase family 2 protein [Pseudomonadota bacterium]
MIIPIYNCEPFLAECLESVLAQTFRNFEVICVDDCSPDGSVQIVDEFLRRDTRIHLVRHERNLGLGGARNTGMKTARADFIASADSDDTMKPNMLEALWNASENGYYDIVTCGFDRVDEAGNFVSTEHSGRKIIVNDGSLEIFSTINPAFWNKLWRKSLYTENNIWFPEHLYYQDTATTPRILSKAKQVRCIPDSLYNYRVRPQSISTTTSPKHIIDYFKVFDIILSFLEREGIKEKNSENFLSYLDRSIAHHAHIGVQHGLEEKEREQYLRHLLAFKIGYIENRKLLIGKTADELLPFLEQAHTISDLLSPDLGRCDAASFIASGERDVDRFWLLALVWQYKAAQSIFAWKKIPSVDAETPLAKLAEICLEFGIDMRPPASFDETDYLARNPDVAQAVERGEFRSGYDHYALHGHLEDRGRTSA